MHVLIWTPPWVGQSGDLFFGLNAFNNHLLLQAKTLCDAGHRVSIAYPETYQPHVKKFAGMAELLPLDPIDSISAVRSWADPSVELYEQGTSASSATRIADWLENKLPNTVDCVLLWETPDAYLRILYPDALIISQMPGAFSRPPYPRTTVFDPCGLYKRGSLFRDAQSIQADHRVANWIVEFQSRSRSLFRKFKYDDKASILSGTRRSSLTLVPLQISGHYAFQSETRFLSQYQFAVEAIKCAQPDNALLFTEYVSGLYRDEVLSSEFSDYLSTLRDGIIHRPDTRNMPSVSQHLLAYADEIVVATSGLALQAMIWDTPVKVVGDTWLAPFSEKGVSTSKQRQKVISYCLERHQPLTDAITSDGNFLSSLIEEMHGRRNKAPSDGLVEFADIERNYDDRLFRSFQEDKLEKVFVKLGLATQQPTKADHFAETLKKTKPKLISFDLFDTLVTRGFEQPADLYRYMELKLRQDGKQVPFDFAEKRLAAELSARANATGDEIQLLDIYREFQKAEDLSEEYSIALHDYEVQVEASCSIPRPVGQRIYREAVKSGVEICVTSDMYLPRSCIDGILRKNGFSHLQLFLSSEVGKTKKSGELFQYIAAHKNIFTSEILHIGDNAITDVKSAEMTGVVPFHVPRAVEYLWKDTNFRKAFPKRKPLANLGRSVIAATIARQCHDDPRLQTREGLSNGNPWELGYTAVGPVILGFALWLRQSAMQDGMHKLHFLSREGKLLKDVFDCVDAFSPSGIESNYLWGSRRAIRVAQMRSMPDILELAKQTIDKSATVRSLLNNRFGVDGRVIKEESIVSSGFESLDEVIEPNRAGFHKLVKILELNVDQILQVAREEREVYEGYLRVNGLFDDSMQAVVDVGWHANMQGSLGQLLGKPLHGYYIATLDAAARWKAVGHKIRAYYGEDCSNLEGHPFLKSRLMVENLLCDVAPSVKRMRMGAVGYYPEPVSEVNLNRVRLISAIHDGARAFAADACSVLGSVTGEIALGPDITFPPLNSFLSKPHPADAKLFLGHPIEDTFSGAEKRYFIAPREKDGGPVANAVSGWQPGEAAIMSSMQAQSEAEVSKRVKNSSPLRKEKVQPNIAPAPRTYRFQLVNSLTKPFVFIFLNDAERSRLHKDPARFYQKAKHPALRGIAAVAFGSSVGNDGS
ncbi:HAD family hydrolase [Rhizobium halophytocola]|uniref:HAD superfamily hydrolase n=1 Tax=Rhizobium halophytocola TaxID=735519 RepID=A0ABS4E2D0_9HYPH|nr:hypothetical protein [Rhizobium halophytocola]MBP1852093.1 putative HAD superfamily hydrolase [Rhizobium halophytocola]